MSVGCVFDIREFTVHDGPGIRTTIFLKGCPLRCNWCHNPEGFSPFSQTLNTPAGERLAGEIYTDEELARIINRQRSILALGEGGITFSGGEPLAQSGFLAELIARLDGVHVILDTSGYALEADFRKVAVLCDLVHFDLKLMDPEAHRRFTGVDNAPILRNLTILAELGVSTVIRVPLVPGVTDTRENLQAIALAASNVSVAGIGALVRVDLLPYNKAAGGKYAACGMNFMPLYDESIECRADTGAFDSLHVPVRVC